MIRVYHRTPVRGGGFVVRGEARLLMCGGKRVNQCLYSILLGYMV